MENIKRALARAKTSIRRTIMAANLDHLLTLTYRENMKDRTRAWRDFATFIRLVRKASPGRAFPFVAVQELQARGAIHIHAAVSGFQNVRLLRDLWHQVIGGKRSGNIDIQHFGGARTTLAKYLSKYISKDLAAADKAGVHRYKRSRGIVIPGKIILFANDVALDCELIRLFEACGATVRFHKNNLENRGPKWFWACSW